MIGDDGHALAEGQRSLSLIGGSLSRGPQWFCSGRWQCPSLFPNALGRLKETWKGTLEQQDGHNNKADTQQEQEPYRNTPP